MGGKGNGVFGLVFVENKKRETDVSQRLAFAGFIICLFESLALRLNSWLLKLRLSPHCHLIHESHSE